MRFTVGEMIPLKGVWFRVIEATNEKIVLEPEAFTKRELATNKPLRERMAAKIAEQAQKEVASKGADNARNA